MWNKSLCSQVEQALAVDPAALSDVFARHCEECENCSGFSEYSSSLNAGFVEYTEKTKVSVERIDMRSRLMAKIDDESAPIRWRLPLTLALTVALVLVLVWSRNPTVAAEYAVIQAPRGATVHRRDTHDFAFDGENRSRLPISVSTQKTQRADISLGDTRLSISDKSLVHLKNSKRFDIASGGVSIDCTHSVHLSSANAPILFSVKGRVDIELKDHSPMKILKRHKITAASAILVIAVYSGWTVLKTESGEERVEASKGAYLDSDGKLHRFDVGTRGDGTSVVAAGSETQNSANKALDSEAFAPTGAYWDEDKDVVQFRIRGEVFDADSGQTLDGFHLQAELIDSKDFGQKQGDGISKTYKGLNNGSFVLDGLGLGSWQITARRQGFAPLTQLLEIADLGATPYLVIPLSGGATLSGRVVDWRGQPVLGATIAMSGCKPDNESEKELGCNLAKSDSSGNFVLEKLPKEETYSITASHKRYGYATSRNLRSSLEGSGQHITISLSGRVRIFGRVSKGKDSRPVVGALVAGEEGGTTTDSTGSYEMTIPLSSNPEVHVVSYPGSRDNLNIQSYPDDRTVRNLIWVDADTHAAEVEINFRLQMSSATLVGRVLDDAGKPLASVVIGLFNTDGWKSERGHETYPTQAITDESGNYQVNNIPSEAGYVIQYRRDEEEEWIALGYVNIPDESEIRADFQLGSASVRGVFVSDDTGEQIALGQVDCSRFAAESTKTPGVFVMAECFSDGRFEIVGLNAGRYTLRSKVAWKNDAVQFVDTELELSNFEKKKDLRVKVKGGAAITWRFRILSEGGQFLSGPYIRYTIAKTNNTVNLHVHDNGVATIQLREGIKDIFIEVPGYEPSAVNLAEHGNSEIISVRMSRKE